MFTHYSPSKIICVKFLAFPSGLSYRWCNWYFYDWFFPFILCYLWDTYVWKWQPIFSGRSFGAGNKGFEVV